MTISIPTTTKSTVLVYHHVQDGVEGYIFNVAGTIAFVAEADADQLARYMLFSEQTEAGNTEAS